MKYKYLLLSRQYGSSNDSRADQFVVNKHAAFHFTNTQLKFNQVQLKSKLVTWYLERPAVIIMPSLTSCLMYSDTA